MPVFSNPAEWTRYANGIRSRVLNEVVFRGEAKKWRASRTRVEWLDTIEADGEADGYRVRKLRYEALPGFWIPALLYEPATFHEKTAGVLNLNGHEALGKAEERWQINCINQAKRGMISLKPDWLGTGQLNHIAHGQMNQIDLTGASGVSVFYLAMSRAIDVLIAHPHVNPARIAVTGLSGGGWQTIVISSLDTRVALADPVAGYSSFVTKSQMPEKDLGDPEQVMTDLGTIADYIHLTALLAPRWALITNNAKDTCCFRADYAPAPLLAGTAPVYKLLGKPERFSHHESYDAGHNYDTSNREAFYAALKRAFYAKDPKFTETEIDCKSELRTPEQLSVPLPDDNLTMNQLAVRLSQNLPRANAFRNPAEARRKLASLVRSHKYTPRWHETATAEEGDRTAVFYQVAMDDNWTVPVVVLKPKQSSGNTILMLSDEGRATLQDSAYQAVDRGDTVIAFDPINFGENRIKERTYLWTLILSGLGDRMLGLEASQIQALAGSAVNRFPGKATVEGYGRRASLAALVAAALAPEIIQGARVHGARASLKELIDENITVEKEPDAFCFGLLEYFDIPQLRKLANASE
jgi:hypothetical protein